MQQTYQKEILVTEPECDITKRMKLSYVMRHAQQMGSDHLLTTGIDYDQMYRDGMVFLVNKMLITFNRRPYMDEKLVLTTLPKQPKGAQFIRDTVFETPAGEKLAEVSISWMLINPHTRKILRPSAFDRYGFQMLPNDGEYITGYRIKAPLGEAVAHMRQIKYSDLDYNRHVNNAAYADIICDTIPMQVMCEKQLCRFGIIYQKEATFGQVLEMGLVPLGEDGYYIGGQVAGGRCFEAEIYFK